ncbi:hypothetical protein PoB_000746900 [Plakobranchus ocellatus]|uniref:Mutator-like transposase domain-containing protein n=1 Tax=Plakobranchus ocellatus TaxID=259542 RepID=A0AAV3YFY8_9GAST|nr:hypothetical protein PoB_000746900 [Plakobranchus ocellatus]
MNSHLQCSFICKGGMEDVMVECRRKKEQEEAERNKSMKEAQLMLEKMELEKKKREEEEKKRIAEIEAEEKRARRRSREIAESMMEKRSSEIFSTLQRKRIAMEKLAEESQAEEETKWKEQGEPQRTILELPQLDTLLRDLRCFNDEGLELRTSACYGMAVEMETFCGTCHSTMLSQFSSSKNITSPSRPKPLVVNEATMMSGMGPYCLNNFCESLEMPSLHQKTFNSLQKGSTVRITDSLEDFFQSCFDCLKGTYQAIQHDDNDDDVIDISVSFDGSWLTRGHKSLI